MRFRVLLLEHPFLAEHADFGVLFVKGSAEPRKHSIIFSLKHAELALYFAVESNFAQVGKKFPTLPFSLRAFDETIGRRRGTADREVEF